MKNKIFFITLLKIAILYLIVTAFKSDKELNIFVSPNGDDGNNGAISTPVRTIERAKVLIQTLRSNDDYRKINVNLMPGEYQLDKPLLFTTSDGGTARCSVTYKAFKAGTAVISGGRQLPRKWIKDKTGKVWKLRLDRDYGVVNQLFANGSRLVRSRSPQYYTLGPLSPYTDVIEDLQVKGQSKFATALKLRKKELDPFCGFSYKGSDLNDFGPEDLRNAELLLYHSWDCSWHKIDKIDKITNQIYLKSPAIYPVCMFSNRNRYVIENSRKYLLNPASWCYDTQKNELFYLPKADENPNTLEFIVPVNQQLFLIKGGKDSTQKVQNIQFLGIQFKYTIAKRGVQWRSEDIVTLASESKKSGIDIKTGFADSQGATESGQAVSLENAEHISFQNCDFTMLGGYAIGIYNYCSYNQIVNSRFSKLGAGGIIIGSSVIDRKIEKPELTLPSNNIVTNNKIYDFGLIYQSGIGIIIKNAVRSKIINNEIFNGPYTGISCGWTWGKSKSYTRENIVEANQIHHVMQSLADGGGIYTLGNQPETVIRGNIIHDIERSRDAVGSRNNGIFFDEGSARIYLDKNEIYNVANELVRYNQAEPEDISWGTNKFNGESVSGSDGQLLISTSTIEAWFKTERFKIIFSNIINTDWFVYSVVLLIVLLIFIFIKIKKMKRKKRYKKQFIVNRKVEK